MKLNQNKLLAWLITKQSVLTIIVISWLLGIVANDAISTIFFYAALLMFALACVQLFITGNIFRTLTTMGIALLAAQPALMHLAVSTETIWLRIFTALLLLVSTYSSYRLMVTIPKNYNEDVTDEKDEK